MPSRFTLFKSKVEPVLSLLERLGLLEEVDDQDDGGKDDQVGHEANHHLKIKNKLVLRNCQNVKQPDIFGFKLVYASIQLNCFIVLLNGSFLLD